MSDDKGEDITGPSKTAAAAQPDAESQPDAQATAGPESAAKPNAERSDGPDKLTGLMAADGTSQADTKAPDLEAQALRAAENALVEGERALAAARAQLQQEPVQEPAAAPGRGRELALRLLLAVNVLAMVVVALLPEPGAGEPQVEAPPAVEVVTEPAPPSQPPDRFNEPWNRAMAAAEQRDFGAAIDILEGYLESTPRMAPSQKLSVFMALSHYASRDNDFRKSQEYQRRADSIDRSHSLPEDLVAMAEAAAQSGDQETLRRVWARFLLQQEQIPSWLYKHVAEAYLELGDSYRRDADSAAERARLDALKAEAERLRDEGARREEKR